MTPTNTPPKTYTIELVLAAMFILKDVALIAACAYTTTTLYQLSNSWHSLWALTMLLAMTKTYAFTRD